MTNPKGKPTTKFNMCMSTPAKNRLLSLFYLSFVLTASVFSQLSEMRIVGIPKEEADELVGKDIRDANGETCAGVIMYSDLTGLTFQSSNGIVKTNHTSGKDFLFVSPDWKKGLR